VAFQDHLLSGLKTFRHALLVYEIIHAFDHDLEVSVRGLKNERLPYHAIDTDLKILSLASSEPLWEIIAECRARNREDDRLNDAYPDLSRKKYVDSENESGKTEGKSVQRSRKHFYHEKEYSDGKPENQEIVHFAMGKMLSRL
jgi:hypothetical protein